MVTQQSITLLPGDTLNLKLGHGLVLRCTVREGHDKDVTLLGETIEHLAMLTACACPEAAIVWLKVFHLPGLVVEVVA